MSSLNTLPESIARQRLLNTEQTAEFIGRSVHEVRRLLRLGKMPKPIHTGGRRHAWRVGDLIDWIESKAAGRSPST